MFTKFMVYPTMSAISHVKDAEMMTKQSRSVILGRFEDLEHLHFRMTCYYGFPIQDTKDHTLHPVLQCMTPEQIILQGS